MSDIDELRQYVAVHPEDGERRWKLAKKLYMASEYEAAANHLIWLKENRAPRLNVVRYLSATYYRLGRYEDAVSELEAALKLWPEEIPLREQFARALEVAGHREQAQAVWRGVVESAPDHSTAWRALERLDGQLPETADQELHQSEHDSGIGIDTGWVCPNCGAQNGTDLDRCWRCHAQRTLPGRITPDPARPSRRPAAATRNAWIWTLILGLAASACLSACSYLTLRPIAQAAENAPYGVHTSVQAVVEEQFFTARLVLGLALLLVWPAVLMIGCLVMHSHDSRRSHRILTGLFLASLAWLLSWSPAAYARYAPLAIAVVSLVPIFAAFRLSLWRACALWLFQIGAVLAFLIAGAAAAMGPAMLAELPVINHVRTASVTGPDPGGVSGGPWLLPATVILQWQSTGSRWLDSHCDTIALVLEAEAGSLPITLELSDSRDIVFREEVNTATWVRVEHIGLEEAYLLSITGPSGAAAGIRVYSPLFPFIQREY